MKQVFPLTLADAPPSKVGRYWRCQAAVHLPDGSGWRQCRRAVNPRWGTTGVFCLCRTHGQPARLKGKVMSVRVIPDA